MKCHINTQEMISEVLNTDDQKVQTMKFKTIITVSKFHWRFACQIANRINVPQIKINELH